jgi:hypothetical protein
MRLIFFLIVLGSLAGCGRKTPPPPPKVFERDQPNAPVTAVQTVPFDDGYKTGFDAGAADAQPKAPIPTTEAAEIKATAAAATDPDRNEKWQHGYADGYLDGFRKVARHTR